MVGTLKLEDGTQISGESYGAAVEVAGEAVFSTGMMGYPESLTDPSYKGQLLILTYPLVGNYGIPDISLWESENIQVSGLIVSSYIDTPSHFQSKKTLAQWFKDESVPLLEIKDTRALTQKIREKGAMLGKIVFAGDIEFHDPNTDNLVAQVSTKNITVYSSSERSESRSKDINRSRQSSNNNKTILLVDCGAKRNIQNALLDRGVTVITCPWDFDPFIKDNTKQLQSVILNEVKNLDPSLKLRMTKKNKQYIFDGIVISNGPGDPKLAAATIATISAALKNNIPTLGICLGHQLLALAAGGNTTKLKYGHRSQNGPCLMESTKRCYITTQNHGFAVSKFPKGFKPWFTNANDGSNEGIIHEKKPFMSVQFHPEATPGPMDAEWIFDYFLNRIRKL